MGADFAKGREELRTKYPTQPWGPVPSWEQLAKPFRVRIDRVGGDMCVPCQDFGSGWLFDPNDAPILPLWVCECDHACSCRYV